MGLLLPSSSYRSLGPYYLIALAIALSAFPFVGLLMRSWVGLALVAIREDEQAAASNGIHVLKFKILAFAAAAFFFRNVREHLRLLFLPYSFPPRFLQPQLGVGALYALCQILWQGIDKAGTLDSAKVRQAVLDNEFQTMMGKVKHDKTGGATFVSTGSQWMDGKQMTVYPFELTNLR